MRRLFLLITALLLLAGPALAYDVLLVQSSRNAAYEEVVRGFRSSCGNDSRVVVLSDFGSVDVVRIVREERPRVVVAIGDEALAAAKAVRQTPVVGVMTLGLRTAAVRGNLTGVDLFVSPERFLPVFQKLNARRVGMLYHPDKTGWYARQAEAAARQAGIDVVLREVRSPRDIIGKLEDLQGKVDALWMIPDTTAAATESLGGYFDFSLRNRVPIVTFTATHLRLGAAAAIEIDRRELGRQAGTMAVKILNGTAAADLPVEQPEAITIKPNAVVLQNLGLSSLVKALTSAQ